MKIKGIATLSKDSNSLKHIKIEKIIKFPNIRNTLISFNNTHQTKIEKNTQESHKCLIKSFNHRFSEGNNYLKINSQRIKDIEPKSLMNKSTKKFNLFLSNRKFSYKDIFKNDKKFRFQIKNLFQNKKNNFNAYKQKRNPLLLNMNTGIYRSFEEKEIEKKILKTKTEISTKSKNSPYMKSPVSSFRIRIRKASILPSKVKDIINYEGSNCNNNNRYYKRNKMHSYKFQNN